jgi:DNA polymerase sigma
VSLGEDLAAFSAYVGLTETELRVRSEIVAAVSRAIVREYPEAACSVFGSFSHDKCFTTFLSDIDVGTACP